MDNGNTQASITGLAQPGGAGTGYRIGERALADCGRREVLVDDVCGCRVRCVWMQDGIQRSAWVAADQLQPAAGSVRS